MFIFQSEIDDIGVYQMQLNCPYPINGGVPVIDVLDPPFINYTYLMLILMVIIQ